MNLKKPIIYIPLRYGLVASCLSIFIFSFLYYLHRNPLLLPFILDFRLIIFPIFLIFAIRDYQINKNNGILHFWQGMSIGMLFVIVVGSIMAIYLLVFGGLIVHDFTSNYIRGTLHNFLSIKDNFIAQYGEKEYDRALNVIQKKVSHTGLSTLSLDYFIKSLLLGNVLTFLISLLFRRNK